MTCGRLGVSAWPTLRRACATSALANDPRYLQAPNAPMGLRVSGQPATFRELGAGRVDGVIARQAMRAGHVGGTCQQLTSVADTLESEVLQRLHVRTYRLGIV